MSYGLSNYVNNKVSDPLFLFFDGFIKKKENVVPKSF